MMELDVKYHGGIMDLSEVQGAITEKYSDQASSDQAEKPQVSEPTENQSQKESSAQAVLDLSKAEKFLIEGKEYTWDQLNKERLLMSDYTRKTQEIANERRSLEEQRSLNEHFKADLPKVLQNPQLMADVMRHYPREFVDMFQTLLDMGPKQQQQVMEQGMQLDSRTIQKFVDPMIKPLQEKLDRYETEALTKQLDAVYTQMKTKYPSADEEFVTARLRAMDDQKIQITDSKIEEVFKFFHDKDTQGKDAYHKEQLKKQSEATAKAKDAPSGGATPGLAPKRLKLDEVQGAFLEHMRRQQQ